MSIKKREFPGIGNLTNPSPTQQNVDGLEKRIIELEKKSHTPCSGGGNAKVDLSSLPELPPRKQTPIHQRLAALEDKVEQLIKLLSE